MIGYSVTWDKTTQMSKTRKLNRVIIPKYGSKNAPSSTESRDVIHSDFNSNSEKKFHPHVSVTHSAPAFRVTGFFLMKGR